jgi:hypothetical protein
METTSRRNLAIGGFPIAQVLLLVSMDERDEQEWFP